ncbi:hypothetical protein FRB96_001819 [Tulasnella sp. 330]|nr:hypothetical protein FRB96_001819 [Tulasnella sp. 330]
MVLHNNTPKTCLRQILIYILTIAARRPTVDEIAQYIERQTIFPFTALSVCRLWRDIAYSSPWMWTSAAIVMDPDWYQRLFKYIERCGTLPVYLNYIIPASEGFRRYSRRLIRGSYFQDKTKVQAVRIIGTPGDGLKYLATIHFLERFGETLEDMDLDWEGPSLNALGYVPSSSAPSAFLRATILFPSTFPVIEKLHFQACNPYTPRMIRHWDMPCLRIFVIDSISRTWEATPATVSPMQTLPLADPPHLLPTVQLAILKDIDSQSHLQIFLSSIPNATALALTTPPEDDPLSVQSDGMTLVIHLTILEPVPNLRMLRRFISSRLPALRVVELNGRCRTGPNGLEDEDLLLLKNEVDVRFLGGDELDLENVLVRMKREFELGHQH